MHFYSKFHRPAKLLAAGGLLFAALLAGQATFAAPPSIIGSKHDLTSNANNVYVSGPGVVAPATAAEPCAFCHTPHGASASAQLWNRGAPATAAFTPYANTWGTLDSASAGPGANSKLCLSCHDGATALDLIINKPGSGGYNALGASASYAWTNAPGGVMPAGSVANFGGSLVNDHPIGVAYCGGVGAVVGTCKDGDFKTATLYKDGGVTAIAKATGNWWVSVTGLATRGKTDLPLYGATNALEPQVECATCHEPHNAGTAPATSFLRISNAASAICTTCHNK